MTTYTTFLFLLFSASLCRGVTRQYLNGLWSLQGEDVALSELKVPGGVFSDLMDRGVIGDIFFGNGDSDYSWVGETEWTYSTTITVDEELLAHRVVKLVFEGLDTFATISINGNEIGSTENMFVCYVFNVKEQLQVGSNEISVKFESAVKKAAALAEDPSNQYVVPPECPASEYHGICHANRIRKMQAAFSWDWGPAFASAGIWKEVYLEAFDDAAIDYVVATPLKVSENDLWTLQITVYFDGGDLTTISGGLNVTLWSEESLLIISSWQLVEASINEYNEISVTTSLEIPSDLVELWWPNGYGNQSLYTVRATFIGENGQDWKVARVGFRTIEVVQDPEPSGLSFYFKVNGYPIFAKGANEIPINVLPELGKNYYYTWNLMRSASDVHMNMLRVWGGGVYESDYFYECANELGILIWQDFMFACAMYPTDEAYLNNVRAEVRHQLKRLGSYPSIAIWGGNNENEGALTDNWYNTSNNFEVYKQDYIKLYVDLIGEEVKRIIPGVNFVTSSPSNGLESVDEGYVADWPGDPAYGDIHFYDYTSDSWNVSTYPIPRFASEYGYQSMPSIEAWNTATENIADLRPNTDFLNNRQHHPDGNQQNLDLINMQLELPEESSEIYPKAFVYFSQISQAQAIKVQTEHYRSFKGRLNSEGLGNTMGALYWQLNDVWVAPTWSGIDFTGRWKMLHYFAKNFFNPMIVTGRLSENQTLEVYAIYDGIEIPDVTVEALIHIYVWDSLEPLAALESPVTLDASKSVLVTEIDAPTALANVGCGNNYDEARRKCFFHLHLMDQNNNHLVPFNYVFLDKLRNCALANANVEIASVTAEDSEGIEFEIVVTTDTIALFVWLDSHQIKGWFSDNGFLHVLPSKTVYFSADEPTTLEQLTAVLTVTHLRDPAYL